MSLNALAELVDRLAADHSVAIHESERCLTASELDAGSAVRLASAIDALQWEYQLVDSENNAFAPTGITEEFAPFRITLHKALPDVENALFLLSTTGFCDALRGGHSAEHWRLARLQGSFITQKRAYGDWTEPLSLRKAEVTRSPRALVRETAMDRRVPDDIREWLLDDASAIDLTQPLHCLWAVKAFDALSRALANELDAQDGALMFRGPPSLQLSAKDLLADELQPLGLEGFTALQQAARWVYELAREAEIRHAMLATEIARSGRDACQTARYFAAHLSNALDGAKVVYQLHLSALTVDTLNALTTLRGSVCDDAARTTESTQQALTKVAAGLGVGLTVIATGSGDDVSPWMMLLVMTAVCLYCCLDILAGWRLIRIRRRARDAWQPRLYRFLPPADYANMVSKPAKRTARVYLWATAVGFGLVVLLSVVVVLGSFYQRSVAAADTEPGKGTQSNAGERERTAPDIRYPAPVWLAREKQPTPEFRATVQSPG